MSHDADTARTVFVIKMSSEIYTLFADVFGNNCDVLSFFCGLECL